MMLQQTKILLLLERELELELSASNLQTGLIIATMKVSGRAVLARGENTLTCGF
jgi:hypothetical protein